jgi:auxin efflux carrier family protein
MSFFVSSAKNMPQFSLGTNISSSISSLNLTRYHSPPSPSTPTTTTTATMVESPLLPLLKVVFFSILEVFLLCLAGYVLAWRGILDRKTQKQLNKLNVSLFTPSLLFSKVAFSLSPEKLKELWIIPLFFVLVTSVSMTISLALGLVFNLKPSQRSFAMAAAMFMNSNSLPIALMQSLVATVPSLKWGDQDDRDSMLGRALTYLVLYSTLGMVVCVDNYSPHSDVC